LCETCGFEASHHDATKATAPKGTIDRETRRHPEPDHGEVLAITGVEQTRRWNAEAPVGTPVAVTYGIPSDPGEPGTVGFSPAHHAAIHQAFDLWSREGGITFVAVPDGVAADIEVVLEDFTGRENAVGNPLSGSASMPRVGEAGELLQTATGMTVIHNDTGGDISMNRAFYEADPGTIAPGIRGYSILIHELGHAVGFKHPFEGNPVIDPALDSGTYTVMSYDRSRSTVELGSIDRDAMACVYGTDTLKAVWRAAKERVDITGTKEKDWLLGTGADDYLRGGKGTDDLFGKLGNDKLLGGDGRDRLQGMDGDDVLRGGKGADLLSDLQGDNRLTGDAGRDRLNSGDGDDTLKGEAGGDRLSAGGGDDRLNGGGGADHLDGGPGQDRLKGGGGRDTFHLSRAGDTDVVADFDPTKDRLTFDPLLVEGQRTSQEILDRYASPLGSDVRFVFWDGTEVLLRNTALTDELAARIDIA